MSVVPISLTPHMKILPRFPPYAGDMIAGRSICIFDFFWKKNPHDTMFIEIRLGYV